MIKAVVGLELTFNLLSCLTFILLLITFCFFKCIKKAQSHTDPMFDHLSAEEAIKYVSLSKTFKA